LLRHILSVFLVASVGISSSINIINCGDIEESKEKIVSMNQNTPIGAFYVKKKYSFKSVRIIYKKGTAGGEAFETLFVSSDHGKPEFILSGLATDHIVTYNRIEKVRSYFTFSKDTKGNPKNDMLTKSMNITFKGKSYVLSRTYMPYKIKYDGEPKPIYEKMYVYSLKTKVGNKLIRQDFQYSFSPTEKSIVWLGDLDNDRKLDIILDYNETIWGEKGLFLSSLAKKNELVHKVDTSISWSMN
jgi:hypothetical protein